MHMLRCIAYVTVPASAIVLFLALAIGLLAGAPGVHDQARHDLRAAQETVFAAYAEHCAEAPMDCDPDTHGSSLPCPGMSGGHCPQAGVFLMPVAYAVPTPAAGNDLPRIEDRFSGIFAAVDTPPPRA